MLNELYHIAKNRVHFGQEPSLVHVDFGEPGLTSYATLQLVFRPDGSVGTLGPYDASNSSAFWTLKKGNFKFFPALRISAPLLLLAADAPEWDRLKKRGASELASLLAEHRQGVRPLAFKQESEQARRILKWQNVETENLKILQDFATVFLQLSADPAALSQKIAAALEVALRGAVDEGAVKAYQALLCGSLKEAKGKARTVEGKVQILLDYRPLGELSGVLYSPLMRRFVLECLNTEEGGSVRRMKGSISGASVQECAFEPECLSLLSGPFPDWSAKPVMAKAFKPFSKFSDAPCNRRYGRADAEGFPIGEETAKALVAAGCAVTSPEMRGKIWTSIRNGKFEGKIEMSDLLIAYPSFAWEKLQPVSIFVKPVVVTKPEEEEEETETRVPVSFTQTAEPFCQALTKNVPERELGTTFIRLLLLRQISPGQVQLVYEANPSRGHFAEAARWWIQSGHNLPPALRVPLPFKGHERGFQWLRPRLLFPEEAMRTLSIQWMRDGTESVRVQAPPISNLFDVFLRKPGVWKDTAGQLLDLLMPRVEPLLVRAGALFTTLRSDQVAWQKFTAHAGGLAGARKPDPRYYLAESLSLLGSLLYSLDSHPSEYMKTSAYQMGKLLALLDELHRCYCVVVREGDIPPTLIGNGLLGRAADAPEQALAELCERARIYIGWAKTTDPAKLGKTDKQREEKRRAAETAADVLSLAAPLCELLHHNQTLAQPMGTVQKAHLFLGYLSPIFGGQDLSPAEPSSKRPA